MAGDRKSRGVIPLGFPCVLLFSFVPLFFGFSAFWTLFFSLFRFFALPNQKIKNQNPLFFSFFLFPFFAECFFNFSLTFLTSRFDFGA